jgi:glycine hydroxymethyltransferase
MEAPVDSTILTRAVAEYEQIVKRSLILDAARNVMSSRVRALLASELLESDLSGRVEAYGTSYAAVPIRVIEEYARKLVDRLFGTSYVEFRVLSGSLANGLASLAVTEPGDAILMPPEWAFGHKSLGQHGYPGSGGRKILEMPWNAKLMGPDLDGLRILLRRERPKLVSLGLSRHLFPEPMGEVAELASEVGALTLYDAAHVLGLIAGGAFPNPLAHGFGLISGSTYKTIPGPHGGIIICKEERTLASVAALGDALVSAYGNNRVAALAQALFEMTEHGAEYAKYVVRNAQALGRALADEGFQVVASDRGFTATHQVLVDVTEIPNYRDIPARLAAANILIKPLTRVDRRLRDGRLDGWWLRIGTSAVTRLGMMEDEMRRIGSLLARLMLHRDDPAVVASGVAGLVNDYRVVKYVPAPV